MKEERKEQKEGKKTEMENIGSEERRGKRNEVKRTDEKDFVR